MSTPSADGAVAAAKYYMDLYGYAFASGDLTAWRAMSADNCGFCNGVIEDVEAMVAKKHTSPGASIEFSTAHGTEVVPDQSYGADVIAVQGPWTEVDATGAVVDSGGSSTVQMYFALGWAENGWLVRQVDVHDAPTS